MKEFFDFCVCIFKPVKLASRLESDFSLNYASNSIIFGENSFLRQAKISRHLLYYYVMMKNYFSSLHLHMPAIYCWLVGR